MANTLTQVGIETGNTVEAYHVTQSIDAFTGAEAYDITLSGSFTLQNGSQGVNKIAVSDANGKISFTNGITASLQGTASYALNALTASHALNVSVQTSGSSLYSTNPATSGFSTNNSIMLGNLAGSGATAASNSNFLGQSAGAGATSANSSNFFGTSAGNGATGANSSNFFGTNAGLSATATNNSNFFGTSAGNGATNASYSNFLGRQAGLNATAANNSNFLGANAGQAATSAINSNFFGQNTGYFASNASYSNLFGYQTGQSGSWGNIGTNNIIIGTNITLTDARRDSINIGGIIFGTGSYGTTTGDPSTAAQTSGRIGIAKTTPNSTLDVNGNTIISGSLTVTGSQVIINHGGSESSPSLYFTNDSNTGFYNRGLSDQICVSTNGNETIRISPLQLIIGDENFKNNENYAQPGLMSSGWVYGTGPLSSNVFFGSGGFGRGLGTYGGILIEYRPTGSGVPAIEGDKIIFATIPSGSSSSATGSSGVTQSAALRIDCNYGPNEPNVEIAHRLSIGTLWAGTGAQLYWDSSTGEVRNGTSDQRFKTNVNTITGSIDIVNSLRGVQFNWTSENESEFKIGPEQSGTQIGLIAQEVEQVLPEVVKPNGVKDYKTVEYDKIVAVLIEAIKEQQQQIDNLQQQIDSLKS